VPTHLVANFTAASRGFLLQHGFLVLQVKWQTVLWGIGLQFIFALIVLRWKAGRSALKWVGNRVTEFLAYSNYGSEFVFGSSYREHLIAFRVIHLYQYNYTNIYVMAHRKYRSFIFTITVPNVDQF